MIASVVANTSLTLRDIEEMRIPAFEAILDGLNENAEEAERELSGKGRVLEGDAAIAALVRIAH